MSEPGHQAATPAAWSCATLRCAAHRGAADWSGRRRRRPPARASRCRGSRGMARGSCWPSSSIVTIQSLPDDAMPASVAACWPKLRVSQTARTWGCFASSSRITRGESSGPLSWTSSTSATWRRWPSVGDVRLEEPGHLVDHCGERRLALVHRDDHCDRVPPLEIPERLAHPRNAITTRATIRPMTTAGSPSLSSPDYWWYVARTRLLRSAIGSYAAGREGRARRRQRRRTERRLAARLPTARCRWTSTRAVSRRAACAAPRRRSPSRATPSTSSRRSTWSSTATPRSWR